MQNQRRHQQVEQIEIIERTVEECSRFNLTHERDAERDPSVLYSPSGLSQPSRFVSPPIFHSTPERSTSINQFGYDLHEVQARADNERVMETHGTGKLLHEESMFDRTGVDGALRSSPIGILKHNQLGLTVGEVEGQSRISPFSDSIQRKDSYRRMQELPHDVSCGEPSNLSAISGRLKHLAEWTGKFFEFGRFKQQKRLSADGSLDKLKGSLTEISRQMRQFTVERVDTSFVQGKFKDPIEDCHNVQWYFLKHTLYTNVENARKTKQVFILRLYIPEWSKYQYKTDATGGHFVYPINLPQNTQRDENGNWVNWKHSTKQQSVTATK
uniref:Uncharacterized protein n=1 Tax=Meloidogyne hapla TaxID=6305 RepID=A0A1I8B1X5_MELHA